MNAVRPGVLIYAMGPSGCGKDSLMHYARQALDESDDVAFAHRYITRPPRAGGENHVALSEREFIARMRMNFFALHWRSHGLYYGIGVEIDVWLSPGSAVVVNGSRAYYPEALRRYPKMLGVLIDASAGRLRARLFSPGSRGALGDTRPACPQRAARRHEPGRGRASAQRRIVDRGRRSVRPLHPGVEGRLVGRSLSVVPPSATLPTSL